LECVAENSDMAWACENCPKARAEDLSPYTRKLLEARLLIKAGYRLDNDRLTLNEWMDLGEIEIWAQQVKNSG